MINESDSDKSAQGRDALQDEEDVLGSSSDSTSAETEILSNSTALFVDLNG